MPVRFTDPPAQNRSDSSSAPSRSLFQKVRRWVPCGSKEPAIWDPEYIAARTRPRTPLPPHRYPIPERPLYAPPLQSPFAPPLLSPFVPPAPRIVYASPGQTTPRGGRYMPLDMAWGQPSPYLLYISPDTPYLPDTPFGHNFSNRRPPEAGANIATTSSYNPFRPPQQDWRSNDKCNPLFLSETVDQRRQRMDIEEDEQNTHPSWSDRVIPGISPAAHGNNAPAWIHTPPIRTSRNRLSPSYYLRTELKSTVSCYPSIDWIVCFPLSDAFMWVNKGIKGPIALDTVAIHPPVEKVHIHAREPHNTSVSLVLGRFGPIEVENDHPLTLGHILNAIRDYFDTALLDSELNALEQSVRGHVRKSYSRRFKAQNENIRGITWPRLNVWKPARVDMLLGYWQYAGIEMDTKFAETKILYLSLQHLRF